MIYRHIVVNGRLDMKHTCLVGSIIARTPRSSYKGKDINK